MKAVSFAHPTPRALEHIAINMREIDALECRCMGHAPLEAVEGAVERSDWAFVASVNETPVCAFGVAPRSPISDVGFPWLLGTPEILANAKPFLAYSRPMIAAMTAEYRVLTNWVHARNHASRRWLSWCGFAFGASHEFSGEPFVAFSMGEAA